MISLKKLDNKNFSKIMEDSRKEIHRHGESWTDENYHDPGITILEMLSWLTEMQRFYIDNVTEQSEFELLKILGINTSVNLSRGTVEFHNTYLDSYIPKAAKLIAEEQIFETTRELYVINNKINSVFTIDDSLKDISRYIDIEDTYFNLFNNNSQLAISEIKAGNSLVLLLDKALKEGVTLSIRFEIKDDYKIKLSNYSTDELGLSYIIHHNSVLSDREAYNEFLKNPVDTVEIIEDETLGFKKSGCIYFKLNSSHKPVSMNSKKGYPLIFTIDKYYNLLEPQIKSISLNNVSVINNNTICDYKIIKGNSGYLYDEIYGKGIIYAQIKNNDSSWSDYKMFEIDRELYPYEVKFKENATFRLLAYDDKQINNEIIGSGNSIPYQRVRFYMKNVLLDNLILSSSRSNSSNQFWFDYIYKRNLLNASAYEDVFTYDFHEQDLIFGNDEFGTLIEDGVDNLKIIRMIKSDYRRGNLKKSTLSRFFNESSYRGIDLSNIDDCVGGKLPSSMDELKREFVSKINSSKTIITTRDFEEAIAEFGHTRILYSKAVASENIENTVDVYAIPFTNTRFYKITESFKLSLAQYLEKYKLISTNIKVKEAEYVEIKIDIKLSVKNRSSFDINDIQARIKTLYNPTEVNNVNFDYRMGTMPSKIDLIKTIKNKYQDALIENLGVNVIGKGVTRNTEGYLLPQNAVIYCNDININLV